MARTTDIVLRKLQIEACQQLDQRKLNVLICHRRFGKTVLAIARKVRNASNTKRRAYRGGYVAPLYRQAKSVAWDYLKFFARPLGAKFSETELRCDFRNGARINLYGADNPDSLRGLDLCDTTFDEVAQMPYRIWSEVVLPMLLANDGEALFIGTPMGKNALQEVWEDAGFNPDDWGRFMYRASETGILTPKALELAQRSMSPEEYAQEFECSFSAAIRGAYFAGLMEDADRDGRITDVPYESGLPVHTAWDLGMSDSTSIWFIQAHPGGKFAVIDFYEASGEGLDHYAKVLDEKGYKYGQHIAPHDIRVRELGTGKSRLEIARGLGIRFDIAANIPVQDGINAIRTTLPRCWFDRHKCGPGIDSLRHYRRNFNDRTKIFSSKPIHDWTSHAVDAFRYFAVGFRQPDTRPRPSQAVNDYNPFGRR